MTQLTSTTSDSRPNNGQWLQVEILGETLELIRVGLYEADGTTPAVMRQEDVDAVFASGGTYADVINLPTAAWPPNVILDWVAPRAGEFLLVVSRVEESVGVYTVTIAALDR